MVNIKDLNPGASPEAAFGARLRSTRIGRGWTQDQLGERTDYSGRHVSAVETGRKSPTRRFSCALDSAFGLRGAEESFERAWREIVHGSLLAGFPEYVGYEARAVEIRLYEVGVVPGLLQTREYASAIEDYEVTRGAATPEQAEERVALVAERQEALKRPRPPMIFVVLDEGCVRRPIGSPEIMDAQFARLLEFADMPNTSLQIAPFAMGVRRTFSLPITILTLPDRSLMSYAQSSQQGHLERNVAAVLPRLTDYHQLQVGALSQDASVALIKQLRKGAA
ncbi:helix-turn-helix domain-containing protein [Streptomyces sp. LE64]|uniref:helix-turn-helix domain-containing protein n=1 Tax=Streptomyces sp. LE64 TaxID=3448653 RepID=UPI004042C4BF